VVADAETLEAKRKELLAKSKNIVKVTTSDLQDKMETERLVERARSNKRKAKEALARAKELADEWKTTVKETHEEAK
jgi:hypothetical protein